MIDLETATPGQIAIVKADLDRLVGKAGQLAEQELFRVPSDPLVHLGEAIAAVGFAARLELDGEGLGPDEAKEYADALLVAAAMALASLAHLRNENPFLLEVEL